MDELFDLVDGVSERLVAEGTFGRGLALVQTDAKQINHYKASAAFELVLSLKQLEENGVVDDDTNIRKIPLIAKFTVKEGVCDKYRCPEVQLANETVMYKKVLPLFSRLWEEFRGLQTIEPLDIFPRCYVAQTKPTKVVVTESFREQGFRLPTDRLNLDKHHVFIALRKLGSFHGLSYAAKVRYESTFLPLTRLLRETAFVPSRRSSWQRVLAQLAVCLDRLVSRGAQPALPAHVTEALRRQLSEPVDILEAAASAHEPLGVVTHGDLVGNSLLFKYGADGRPEDVRFLNFQRSKYCSPAVDLSFFIFLMTTPAVRSEHWHDMFEAYHQGLNAMATRLLPPAMSDAIPSLGEVMKEFRRHALWGFIHSALLLPSRMTSEHGTPSPEELGNNPNHFATTGGGGAGTDLIEDLLLEFVNRDLINC